MAFNLNSDDDAISDINVTPLVDVMLVLLILFMITMPVLTHSIDIELPKASIGKQEDSKPIKLAISSVGEYFIEDKKYTLDEISFQFDIMKKNDPNITLAIIADKETAYNYIAKILETAKKSNLTKVGFVTEKK